MTTDKITQIIPAPAGLRVDSVSDSGNPREARVLAVGLTGEGKIVFVYYDGGDEFGVSTRARWSHNAY